MKEPACPPYTILTEYRIYVDAFDADCIRIIQDDPVHEHPNHIILHRSDIPMLKALLDLALQDATEIRRGV